MNKEAKPSLSFLITAFLNDPSKKPPLKDEDFAQLVLDVEKLKGQGGAPGALTKALRKAAETGRADVLGVYLAVVGLNKEYSDAMRPLSKDAEAARKVSDLIKKVDVSTERANKIIEAREEAKKPAARAEAVVLPQQQVVSKDAVGEAPVIASDDVRPVVKETEEQKATRRVVKIIERSAKYQLDDEDEAAIKKYGAKAHKTEEGRKAISDALLARAQDTDEKYFPHGDFTALNRYYSAFPEEDEKDYRNTVIAASLAVLEARYAAALEKNEGIDVSSQITAPVLQLKLQSVEHKVAMASFDKKPIEASIRRDAAVEAEQDYEDDFEPEDYELQEEDELNHSSSSASSRSSLEDNETYRRAQALIKEHAARREASIRKEGVVKVDKAPPALKQVTFLDAKEEPQSVARDDRHSDLASRASQRPSTAVKIPASTGLPMPPELKRDTTRPSMRKVFHVSAKEAADFAEQVRPKASHGRPPQSERPDSFVQRRGASTTRLLGGEPVKGLSSAAGFRSKLTPAGSVTNTLGSR